MSDKEYKELAEDLEDLQEFNKQNMSEEIKEILRNCEKAINDASGYNDTTDKILDYITNLQQKVEQLENIRKEVEDCIEKRKYYLNDSVCLEDVEYVLNKGSEDSENN